MFWELQSKKTDLKTLFSLLPEANDLEIDGLLYPKDKQNVPSATKFLLTYIEAVRNVPVNQFPYRLVPIREHLLVLANAFEGLLSFYVDTKVDIKKQIVLFSAAAYSLFYLYRAHSSKLLPNQLYHDLQSTFIDALFCCAKAQIYFPNEPLYLVLNGTDPLERIFGVLRMNIKNASMDYLTLVQCLGSMIKCDEILTMKHPEWSRKVRSSRRLCLDYSNPKSWYEDKLKLRDINIRALWESGHMKARADALEYGIVKSDDTIEALMLLGYTLKKPKGKLIGVTEPVADVSLEVDEEYHDDNEQDIPDEDSGVESIPLSDLLEKNATIEVDGKNIYKASVVNSLFSSNALSKDRLKRVQGLTTGTPGQTTRKSDDDMIFIGDPLVVYFDDKTAVANIHKISLGNQNKKCLDVYDLEAKNLTFDMRFLNLVEEGDCYFWDGTFTGDVQKVHGDKCVMIKPSVSANPPAGMSNFYYDRQFLLDIGVQFTLANQAGTGSSKQKTSEVQKNKCRICHKNIACNKMRGHVGYHILMKDIATNVCGFCGLQSCSNKLKQSSKSSTTKYFKLESSCAYFFAYGRKPVYSTREKCSNHLARCDVSKCSAHVWKYNMVNHYEECHNSINIPEHFIISEDEKKSISTFKN